MAITPLLNVQEASELLAVPVRGVYRLAELGELPFVKIGERLRFSREQIEEWLEEKTSPVKVQ